MLNQAQGTTQAPAVPATIHIWMFATAAISTVFVIPHAIVTAMWHWPPTIANLHYIVTLGFWIAGIVFVTRQPSISIVTIPTQPDTDANPIRSRQLTEIEKLSALLDLTDDGR